MKRLARVAVLVPFIALLGWSLSLAIGLASGTAVRLRIEGSDPRDFLRGHYIRYSLTQGGKCEVEARLQNDLHCGCLTPEPNTPYSAISWIGLCDRKPADCALFLKGSCRSGRFTAGVEEYYIPEELAPALKSVPEDSAIVLAVSRTGRSQVVKMLVGDIPVEEYARAEVAK